MQFQKFTRTAIATLGLCLLAACGGGGHDDGEKVVAYPVGRTSVEWTDSTRSERCGGVAPGTPRRMQAYVWYPAQPAAAALPAPLFSSSQAATLAELNGVPEDALRKLTSRSYAEAPAHDDRRQYPVLVMSHGAGGGAPLQYSSTAEALAAAGYVVIGLSHPYHSLATFYADGTTALIDPACDPEGIQPEITATSTFDDFIANWRATLSLDEYLTQDVASAVRQLEALNSGGGRLAGRLQVDRVGVLGHSFGGSHAFRAAATLPAVAAAANIDGTVFSERFAAGAGKPYLTIASVDGDPPATVRQTAIDELLAMGLSSDEAAVVAGLGQPRAAFAASRPAYMVRIPAARHMNFSDVPSWAAAGVPVATTELNMTDAKAITELQDALLVRFFDRHLRGRPEVVTLPQSALPGTTLESSP